MKTEGESKLRGLTDDFDKMSSEFISTLDLDLERLKEIATLVTETVENAGYDIVHYIGAMFVIASASMETVMEVIGMSERE